MLIENGNVYKNKWVAIKFCTDYHILIRRWFSVDKKLRVCWQEINFLPAGSWFLVDSMFYAFLLFYNISMEYFKYRLSVKWITFIKYRRNNIFVPKYLWYQKRIVILHRFKRKALLERGVWRGGRVVDCGGLENRCTARYPGFESLSLRFKKIKSPCKLMLYRDFLCLFHSRFYFSALLSERCRQDKFIW